MFNQRPGRVRVGPLDAEFAGARVWLLIGPTECADSSGYLDVLSRIAEGGPANRVGLNPQRDRLNWRFDPQLSPSVVAGDLDLDPLTVDETMNRLVRRTVDQPIVAANLNGHLALCLDHGIGDAHAIGEIAAALTRAGDPSPTGFVPPQPNSNIARPLSRIARRLLAAGPLAITRDIAHELNVVRVRRGFGADEEAERPGRHASCGPAAAHSTMFVRSEPEFLSAVRELRDRRYDGVSAATLVFYSLRQSLLRSGVDLTDITSFLTDLRRYLRPGDSTLANLSMVANAITPEGQSFGDFTSSLVRATGSTSPATRTLVSCAIRSLRTPDFSTDSPVAGRDHGKVELTLSDVSRLPSMRKFHYRSGSLDRITVVALPPGGRNQLTIALVTVGDELQLTATYFPDVVSAEYLANALQRALTLEELTEARSHLR